MTTEDIADGVVAKFKAIDDPLVVAVVAKPEIIPEYETEEDDEAKVDVIPYEETEESLATDDTAASRLTVTVVVSWPIGPSRNRSASIAALKQFRDALRDHEIGRYHWQANETVSLFDAQVLRTKHRFLSVFRATYFDVN